MVAFSKKRLAKGEPEGGLILAERSADFATDATLA